MQLSEARLEGDAWDLHLDGTSRSGKKYVGHQANIDGHVFSAGFTPASVENTTTFVDLSFTILQELSEVVGQDDAQQNFVAMLSTLCGTMTDQASVMKSFSWQFDIESKEMLQTESSVQLLHCNAHVLLGISTACEKVLKQAEKESSEKFGQDKLAAFASFQLAPVFSHMVSCLSHPNNSNVAGMVDWASPSSLSLQSPPPFFPNLIFSHYVIYSRIVLVFK